jgi:hypothetical protein
MEFSTKRAALSRKSFEIRQTRRCKAIIFLTHDAQESMQDLYTPPPASRERKRQSPSTPQQQDLDASAFSSASTPRSGSSDSEKKRKKKKEKVLQIESYANTSSSPSLQAPRNSSLRLTLLQLQEVTARKREGKRRVLKRSTATCMTCMPNIWMGTCPT